MVIQFNFLPYSHFLLCQYYKVAAMSLPGRSVQTYHHHSTLHQ